jgi:hypothetical protein
MEPEPEPETKAERIRRVAREWYRKNKERIRRKKLDQCHEYRRRVRLGRPTRIETHPERVMTFNTQTRELSTFVPESEPEPERQPVREREPEVKREPEPQVSFPRTVERGSFLVKF